MAITVYTAPFSSPNWDFMRASGGKVYVAPTNEFYPFPEPGSVQSEYLNKCVDGISGEWHLWRTYFQDTEGLYYKSSGGQQFDAGTYKVESISFGEEPV